MCRRVKRHCELPYPAPIPTPFVSRASLQSWSVDQAVALSVSKLSAKIEQLVRMSRAEPPDPT